MIEFLQPPPDPTNPEAHSYRAEGIADELYMPETSRPMLRDWAIRTMMEQALSCDDDTVHEITKLLAGQTPLVIKTDKIMPLERPFEMPSVKNNGGSKNNDLREFAFEAYDALERHFDDNEWKGWFIAPCFFEGDDTAHTFELRIYVDEINS